MPGADGFQDLACYYDTIMAHVDYNRWYWISAALARLLPKPAIHLDAACGTGVLVRKLREEGWTSFGFDLSFAMAQQALHRAHVPAICADLRAVPFRGAAHYATCLFDSLNFLLDESELRAAFREIAGALAPGGILYFDTVTERMVLDHFAGQEWNERNGGFATSWACTYDRASRIAEMNIRVNHGAGALLRERIYSQDTIEDALSQAGLELLAVADAESWKPPRRKTIRTDYIAVKGSARHCKKAFAEVNRDLRKLFA